MLKSFLSVRAWLPILLSLLIASWIVASSSAFQGCVDEQHYQAPYKPSEKDKAALPVWITDYSHCTGAFIHENADAIIATFTVFLFVSTVLLWVATRDSMRSAEQTSREVNRAYLACGGDFNKITRIFNLDVENNGQTPAFMLAWDVQTAMTGQIGMQSAMKVNRTHQHWEDTIPPRSSKKFESRIAVPKGVAFVFGCVWYKDVWDKPHCTRFLLSVDALLDRTLPNVVGAHRDYTKTT